MTDLINHPAFQAAVAPFFVALIVGFVFGKIRIIPVGIALVLAWLVTVWLTVGFTFEPLTSTRKIILLAMIAGGIGFLLDALDMRRHTIFWILGAASASAAIWMIWPVLKSKEGSELWATGALAAFYALWHVALLSYSARKEHAASVAALALGTGTGVSALLGASALLAQLGGAIAAAAGALTLLLLLKQNLRTGYSLTLPVSLLSSLIGISAVVYASLPWYTLAPLLIIPVVTHTPFAESQPGWRKLLIHGLLMLAPAGASIAITWNIMGPPPL